jgi:hypothetical protein
MAGSNISRVVPHSIIPGVVAPISQDVDYLKAFAGVTKYGDLGSDYLYLPTLDKVHTPTTVGQQWRGGVDSAQFSTSQLAWQYYTIQSRMEYTDQQAAKLAKMLPGIGIDSLLDKLCRQGINQRRHYGAIFGFDPAQTQGLVKQGITESLPADSDSHTTISTYNADELLAFLASQAREAMNNSYGMAKPVVFMSSVRLVNYIKTVMVNLTSYQMPGAGVDSIGGAYSRIVGEWLGVGKVEFIGDDLLKEAGTAGDDLIILVAPGLTEQDLTKPEFSQYLLGDLPANMMNTFIDNAGGLVKTVNPIMNRVSSADYSLQTTPGAVIRQAAVRVIEADFV